MSILYNCLAGYLGYYASLEDFLAKHSEGGEPGSFFLNGETSTLWMWNPVTSSWCDANYRTAPDLVGMVVDPETFSPPVAPGREGLYYFVAGAAGVYAFPALKASGLKVEVECSSPSIVLLHWDGSRWTTHVYPVDMASVALHCYRGLWEKSVVYSRSADTVDVVLYGGKYYRPAKLGTIVESSPDSASSWEELPGYTALANGLQVIERNGQGILTLSPDMCALTVNAPDGSKIAELVIEPDEDLGNYVRQTFTRRYDDTVYATTISANGIYITEGTSGGIGSVIKKRCVINADGIQR